MAHRIATDRASQRARAVEADMAGGAIKEELGDLIDDKEMENKGARENAAGKNRQQKNDAV